MKALLGWLLLVPLVVFIGVFSIENHAPLSLKLWPLPGVFELSASVWILALLAIGLLTGLLIGWLSVGKWRKRARTAQRQLDRLNKEAVRDAGHTSTESFDSARSGRHLTLSGNRPGRT